MKHDKIISICEVGEKESIDIEVSGNHYFYANGILTHNSNSDFGLEDTSESFGLPATADLFLAMISTEDLDQNNQILIKQLKNRYNDHAINKKFIVGINRARMKLFDVPKSQQHLIESNQTEEQKSGFGFDGRSFDSKFSKNNRQKFTSWTME